ncbi:MAG TPA: DUF2239 family protein [Caulobacteraceae bacterium]
MLTAFAGERRLASGPAGDVAAAARRALDTCAGQPLLVFDQADGRAVDLDLRGSPDECAARAEAAGAPEAAPRGPGRPKLGVVAREVTLLPRHWDWLAGQPGGASAALRRLVEAARREAEPADRSRQAREACYRFISAMAGDRPGFEAATRALFAGDAAAFAEHTEAWPDDVRAEARRLAG